VTLFQRGLADEIWPRQSKTDVARTLVDRIVDHFA
jgi:hypothetical protein